MNPSIRKALGMNVGRRRISAGAQWDPSSVFWDCEFTKREVALLLAVIALVAALHLTPVLHSGLGTILTYALPTISYLSPVTGFFFIACSQFVPFPDGSPHNPAQAGVLVWLPVVLLRYRRVNLTGLWRLWPIVPWLLWFAVLTGEPIYFPNSEYVKSLVYCVIACQLANEARGRLLKCLLGLSLGALLVMTAFWASQFGLPVEISDWGTQREGIARMGGVRADSVMVWPALLLGISGLLGLQIAFASRRSPRPSPAWITYWTIALCVASMPALVATMCHGALAGLALVVAALIGAGILAGKEGAFGNVRFQMLLRWSAASVAVIVALFIVNAFDLRTKLLTLDDYYKNASEETGMAASRTGVWHDSIHTILKYPLFGIRVTGDREEITSEYASQGDYLSHNVFLDVGRAIGIPGMLMVALFFFYPAVKMWKSEERVRYLPFLLAHFAMFIFWMSLSFQFYKTFWGLWMLMAMVPTKARPQGATVRRQWRTDIREPGLLCVYSK